MVLSINSSAKIVVGISVCGALALGTILFYRYRGNAVVQQEASSLDKERVSFMNDISNRVYSLLYAKKSTDLAIYTIGTPNSKFSSVEDLTSELDKFSKQRRRGGALVIYGNNLQLTQDPGILALEPIKLILVGIQITNSCKAENLEQKMMNCGWLADVDGITVVEVTSVDEAVKISQTIDFTTSNLVPTVYSVKA